MPDFAPSATKRVIETYISAGIQHTMLFRRARSESVAAALTAARATFVALVTALQPGLPEDFQWVTEEYILEDSEVRLPSGWTGPGDITGDSIVANMSAIEKIRMTNFQGKGSGGSKARITVYGIPWAQEAPADDAGNGRVTTVEDSLVSAAVAALNSGATTYAIDNTVASWYPYVNIKTNDFLLRSVRRGLIG